MYVRTYVPYYESGDDIADLSHDAGVEPKQDLHRDRCTVELIFMHMPRLGVKLLMVVVVCLWDSSWLWVTYKDPEEDSDLEGILEENDVDENED